MGFKKSETKSCFDIENNPASKKGNILGHLKSISDQQAMSTIVYSRAQNYTLMKTLSTVCNDEQPKQPDRASKLLSNFEPKFAKYSHYE